MQSSVRALLSISILILAQAGDLFGRQQPMADNPSDLLRNGDKVIAINEAISMVEGFGNTFLVKTAEGNVIIDTSIVLHARKHKELLGAEAKGPIKYIILTH